MKLSATYPSAALASLTWLVAQSFLRRRLGCVRAPWRKVCATRPFSHSNSVPVKQICIQCLEALNPQVRSNEREPNPTARSRHISKTSPHELRSNCSGATPSGIKRALAPAAVSHTKKFTGWKYSLTGRFGSILDFIACRLSQTSRRTTSSLRMTRKAEAHPFKIGDAGGPDSSDLFRAHLGHPVCAADQQPFAGGPVQGLTSAPNVSASSRAAGV